MSTDSTNAAVVKLATNDGANFDAPADVLRLSRAINSMLQDLEQSTKICCKYVGYRSTKDISTVVEQEFGVFFVEPGDGLATYVAFPPGMKEGSRILSTFDLDTQYETLSNCSD
ncbi:hypothetical protein KIN20_015044 [Parelaphostrongylus tenuis]|uniref:SKP1 component POZ domain-containing protein n=1 Tax=Parelaphostrongylus tenuis TaxID=148309 RepID=A0AAD5QNQ9_PARTN|nr:hypothetical protein KIN20_015044 [Parelaphostrongylus tenuis]